MIYRQGLLAVDPPVYRKVAGPQQPTEVHNTLLIGGQNQRRCRGQWFRTLEEFEDNRTGGNLLETGDILSYTEAGDWASVSCQYAQSYPDSLVASCVRQLLFIRPDRILVVDQLTALPGKTLPEVQWLLQLPVEPERLGRSVTASDSTSWLTCSDLTADGTGGTAALEVTATEVNTHRVSYRYSAGGRSLTMVHSLRTGDGKPMQRDVAVSSDSKDDRIVITAEGVQFQFLKKDDYAVSRMGKP